MTTAEHMNSIKKGDRYLFRGKRIDGEGWIIGNLIYTAEGNTIIEPIAKSNTATYRPFAKFVEKDTLIKKRERQNKMTRRCLSDG